MILGDLDLVELTFLLQPVYLSLSHDLPFAHWVWLNVLDLPETLALLGELLMPGVPLLVLDALTRMPSPLMPQPVSLRGYLLHQEVLLLLQGGLPLCPQSQEEGVLDPPFPVACERPRNPLVLPEDF